MGGFKLSKKLYGWPESSILFVFQALADALFGVGLRGDIKQALISLSVLHDCSGLPVHGKHYGALTIF
jgi:NAD(P)H-hydrate repair Nnr-like enzyme with NAD(P)H-hydrate epimerase domain